MTKANRHPMRWLSILLLLLLAMPAAPSHSYAQGNARLFPETGKTVRGKFLDYWTSHGGLAQQGFPISEEMPEKSDTDGRIYTVQYFERAVFELHPEFAGTPSEVLLSLLGVFFYTGKYPSGGPGQVANNEQGVVLFQETGKHLGGKFLAYWQSHGGLAQQGFPISEEFIETSPLNGQAYKVQYFQRAVFELHTEFAGTPNEVLLSQLGTFRYRDKYLTPVQPTVPVSQPTTPPVQPTTPPVQPTTPPVQPTTPPANPCSGIPAHPNVLVVMVPPTQGMAPAPQPDCAPAGYVVGALGKGFAPNENVGVYVTDANQAVNGAPFQVQADETGVTDPVTFRTSRNGTQGIWAITFEGTTSHIRAIGYFKVLAP